MFGIELMSRRCLIELSGWQQDSCHPDNPETHQAHLPREDGKRVY